ncbi:MAG: hybrid sensor histidine kinase/response regulator [Pseudomonadota bacterium]
MGKPKILIVDDIPENISILGQALKADYDVMVATSGKRALALAESDFTPDLILLDIMMPEMDGYEVCRRLKEKESTRDIPVVFVTAKGKEDDETKGLSLGAVDYISKPFSLAIVKARVKTHLELKLKRDQLVEYQQMLEAKVGERTRALSVANQLLNKEIEVRQAVEVDLIKAKELAEAASRAKSQFLANLTHEFRTPMTAIIGLTDVILEINRDEQAGKNLEAVKDSAVKLLEMVNDVIEIVSIETGGVRLSEQGFEPRSVLAAAVAEQAAAAKKKNIALTWELEPGTPSLVVGDFKRLTRILSILIGNGVKFSESGCVSIKVFSEPSPDFPGGLHFSVADTGIGIAAESMERLFDDLTQADGSRTRKYGGLGLGLTMVRKIVGLMGGKIWLESAPGQGSVFHLVLPLEALE